MTDQEDSSGKTVIPVSRSFEGQGELFDEYLKVEKERIESENKKTDVNKFAIEASVEADKRQYDYHMTRLANDTADKMRRHDLAQKVIYIFGSVVISMMIALFGLMFFGNDIQQARALEAWKILLIGAGGYGILSGIFVAVKKLLGENGK